MTIAKSGDKVRVHYTGTLKDGRVFDTSKERGALDLVIGEGTYFDDFESAIEGMSPGEIKTEVVGFDGAFGPARQDMIIETAQAQCPEGLKVGDRLRAVQEGEEADFVVLNIEGGMVTLDGNHPLAGHDLIFEIELLEILDSTTETKES